MGGQGLQVHLERTSQRRSRQAEERHSDLVGGEPHSRSQPDAGAPTFAA